MNRQMNPATREIASAVACDELVSDTVSSKPKVRPMTRAGPATPTVATTKPNAVRKVISRSFGTGFGNSASHSPCCGPEPVVRLRPMDLYPWAIRTERFDESSFASPRAEWRPDRWSEEPDFVEWRMPGVPYPLLAARGPGGSLCGYVGVPEGHCLHGGWS